MCGLHEMGSHALERDLCCSELHEKIPMRRELIQIVILECETGCTCVPIDLMFRALTYDPGQQLMVVTTLMLYLLGGSPEHLHDSLFFASTHEPTFPCICEDRWGWIHWLARAKPSMLPLSSAVISTSLTCRRRNRDFTPSSIAAKSPDAANATNSANSCSPPTVQKPCRRPSPKTVQTLLNPNCQMDPA
jgi:hypothetical protein